MNCTCGRQMMTTLILGMNCYYCAYCKLAIKIEVKKMSAMKIWKEKTKWINKGWKGEKDKIRGKKW